jgi:hypothetical protein
LLLLPEQHNQEISGRVVDGFLLTDLLRVHRTNVDFSSDWDDADSTLVQLVDDLL